MMFILALAAGAALLVLSSPPARRRVVGRSGTTWFTGAGQKNASAFADTVRVQVFDGPGRDAHMVLQYRQVVSNAAGNKVGQRIQEFVAPSTLGLAAQSDFGIDPRTGMSP